MSSNPNLEKWPSKLPVAKTKRKSLIPLPTSNAKFPGSATSSIPHSIHVTSLSAKKSCVFRRNSRSIHSSTIPIWAKNNNDNFIEDEDSLENQSEGSLLATSKESVTKYNLVVSEWRDDQISYEIEDDKIKPPLQSHNSCMKTKKGKTKNNVPKHWMIKLALNASKVACRTRGYFLCPICSEPFSRPAIIACGHLHCMQCVCSWLEDQDSCPVCRYRIIAKNMNNTLTAKDFLQSGLLLASVFIAGNFHENFIFEKADELASLSIGESPSAQFQQHITMPHFISSFLRNTIDQQQILLLGNDSNKRRNDIITKVIEGNCFSAAVWFLRHGLQLTKLHDFQGRIKDELQHGCDSSRELFVKKIMTKKQLKVSDRNGNFIVPKSSLINNLQKKLASQQRYPRFRLPSTQGLGKILMTCFIFIVIAFAIHIFDDSYSQRAKNAQNEYEYRAKFHKIDFLVFSVTLFSMATYSENERIMSYWRRRRRGNNVGNYNRPRGRRHQRQAGRRR